MTIDPREIDQLLKRVAELEAIEERYRALLEDGNAAVFVTDLESNTYVEVNREAVELLGYSEQELLHMGPADIVGEGAPWADRLRGARILLVEDHPLNQELAMEVLSDAGPVRRSAALRRDQRRLLRVRG